MSAGELVPPGLPADIPGPVWTGLSPAQGLQALWRFPNGYGASVIKGEGSYGVELAVIRWQDQGDGWEFDVVWDSPVTDDVLGHLTLPALVAALRAIRDLPSELPE